MKLVVSLLVATLLLTSCKNESSKSKENDSTPIEEPISKGCKNLDTCDLELYGIAVSRWIIFLKDNFSSPMENNGNDFRFNVFLCGDKIGNVYVEEFGKVDLDVSKAMYDFGRFFLDLETCTYKSDYENVIRKLLNL